MNYRLLLIGIAAWCLVAGTPSVEHAAADDAVSCDNAVGATCKGDFAAPKPPMRKPTPSSTPSSVGKDGGRKDDAIAKFAKILRLDPKNISALLSRGTAYRENGDLESAVADYKSAIELDPGNVEAYIARGTAYRYQGDLNRAIADYKLAIMLAPDNARAYNNRGMAYGDKGDLDRAIADYDKAIALDPEYAEPYFNRGRCYNQKGEVDRAIADYSEAIKVDPTLADAYISRGLRYADKGDAERAVTDFTRAIAADPNNADAFGDRCWVRLVAGQQLQAALSDCSESLRIRSSDADTFNTSGLLYLKADRPDDAITNFSAAIKIDAKLASAVYGRGLAKLKKGDVAGANGDMTAARAIDPGVAQELERYGIK